jgi:predicted ATPase
LDKREAFHLLIGARMYILTPKVELEKSIFDIASQISLGKRLLQSDEQKYEAAELILLAGEVSLGTSAFHSAATYFMSGIDLLG